MKQHQYNIIIFTNQATRDLFHPPEEYADPSIYNVGVLTTVKQYYDKYREFV
jgi:hypothetical protein